MKQSPATSWLLKCALMAAAVLAADRAVTAAIGTRLQQPAATARDGSLVTLNRYVQEPVPELVLVGSSITWRLKEEFFPEGLRVRNLALAGGSPVTGLEIVAKQPRLPKTVLIETNVLSRPVDQALVARFSGHEQGETFLRPVRTAVAAFETWNHAPPDPARLRARLDALLSQPPSEFDNRVYLDRMIKDMNAEDPAAAAHANVVLIRQLMTVLARRGTRALLMQIPLAPELEETHAAKVTRQIVQQAFPDRNAWLAVDAPLPELRWADGLHLDERSALVVTRALAKALAARSQS
jgi:hypothetical protein